LTAHEIIKVLGGWEGYSVHRIHIPSADEVHLELVPDPGPGCCDGCGELCSSIHDTAARWVRDLPVFDWRVRLLVHRRRVLCPHCGAKVERLSWLGRYHRYTNRLGDSVARWCKVATIKHVAEQYGLNRKTVKQIDKAYLHRELGSVDLSCVTILAMDEFAIQKGHRYATVIVDPTCKQVLWVGRGRKRTDIRPFFEQLGKAGCDRIEAVVMDMNAGYEIEVKAQCENAKVVYDLYHVVAKYNRQVTDRVRVDEANRLREDKPARKVVKSARWLLLKNKRNLDGGQAARLEELLAANQSLLTVYVLKDDLKRLWRFSVGQESEAKRLWLEWFRRAIHSRLAPLVKFARGLRRYIADIFNHCRYPLHTGLLEGINNKIKVIKRMAYGYRDDDYFFLKIRQAFPGNGT